MKTLGIVSLVAALVIGSSAAAATVSVSEGYKFNDNGTENPVTNLNVSQGIGTFVVPLTVDGNFQNDWNRPTHDVQKYEGGLKANVYGPLYLRVAFGDDVHGGPLANDFGYYSFTGGAAVPVVGKVSLEGSVRYRAAFSGDNEFTTWTFKGGPAYALTSKDVLHAYVDREIGSGSSSRRNNTELGLGYSHSF